MVHIRGGTGGLGQEGIIEEMAYWYVLLAPTLHRQLVDLIIQGR